MRPEDAEPGAGRDRGLPTLAWATVREGIVVIRPRRGDLARLASSSGSAIRDRSSRTGPIELRRRQALLGVIAVELEVLLDQPGHERVPAGREGAALQEDPVQRPGAIDVPSIEGTDQGLAVDEIDLERQQAEEQVAIG